MTYIAVPANPEERTHIEGPDGELVCFVEGFGDNHEDFEYAKYFAGQLEKGELEPQDVERHIDLCLDQVWETRYERGRP